MITDDSWHDRGGVARLGDHHHVGLRTDDRPQSFPDDGMIFDAQDSNGADIRHSSLRPDSRCVCRSQPVPRYDQYHRRIVLPARVRDHSFATTHKEGFDMNAITTLGIVSMSLFAVAAAAQTAKNGPLQAGF